VDYGEARYALSKHDPELFISPGMVIGYMRDTKVMDWFMCHAACGELGKQTAAMQQQIRAQKGGAELTAYDLIRIARQREARMQTRLERQYAQEQAAQLAQIRRQDEAIGKRMEQQIRRQAQQLRHQEQRRRQQRGGGLDLAALLQEARALPTEGAPQIALEQIPF
jgi:hypothetical protein